MDFQIEQIVRDKILLAIDTPPPAGLTRRDVTLPDVRGKAITAIGMRRSGKTSWLHQCRADLIAGGRSPSRLLYFNFEDERLGELTASQLGVIPDTLLRLSPEPTDEPVTLFLDEIQRVPGWEVFVRRMLDTPDHELFLSGSSAKLLSREIATSMRGRAWELVIQPFSYPEFIRHQKLTLPLDVARMTSRQAAQHDYHFARYLAGGGFPEAQGLSPADSRQLLQGYVDVLLLRDVIERHAVSNVTALRWLVRRLLGNPAGSFSVVRFANDLKSQGIAASREMLHEYLAHIEDAFLLRMVAVDSDSEKRRQVNPRKVYPADTGLIPVFSRSSKPDTGHALESVVFNELIRRGAEVAYVKTADGHEVDFCARHRDGAEELLQVSTSIADPGTLEREVRALQSASSLYPRARKFLLTQEFRLPFPAVPKGIEVQAAWQWILGQAR